MATISEASQQSGSSDKAAGLIGAIGVLSGEQTFTFELYKRVVLPMDGFVFWIKASELSTYVGRNDVGALYSQTSFARTAFDALQKQADPTPEQLQRYKFSINGSLHISQEVFQEPDATYVNQDVSFTTKVQTVNFDSIASNELYILSIPDGYPDKLPLRIAFGRQRNRYTLAGLWHYTGKVINSIQATQVVDNANNINPDEVIVSNSMPYWLGMSTATIPVYPAFLSPKNLTPPYITVDVQSTDAIQAIPLVADQYNQAQLVTDTIEFTMYGLNNSAALDFQIAVIENSEYGEYGIQNMPVPIDEKITQSEFQVIAQKKVMKLQAAYYQYRAREYARRLITEAFIALTPEPHNFPVPIIV